MIGKIFLLITTLLYITYQVASASAASNVLQQTLTINLSNYDKENKQTHLYENYVDLSQGDATVDVINAPRNRQFFVVQAHSLEANVTISKTAAFARNSSLSGTHVGLVEMDMQNSSYRYFVRHQETPHVKILVALVVYERNDPIPGGCNMIFNTEIAPYQLLSYDDNIVRVDAQSAGLANQSCESRYQPRLDMYHMYLPERNNNFDVYFDVIKMMLTVDGIKKNAKKVPEPIGNSLVQRYYSAYPGTGSVYAIIATFGNASSAYVPTATYACDFNKWEETCIRPVSTGWKVICALILFLGLFMCYFGHNFFKTHLFIFGFICGGFISYITASFTGTLTVGQSLAISITFGFLYGILWLIFWVKFGSPILSVFLPVSSVGYVVACVMYHGGVGDLAIFESNVNYWGVLMSIVIGTTAILLAVTMFGNILSCSVLGATAVIVSIDHYIGGAVHYAFVNNFRRGTVYNFNYAVLDPPFQFRDIVVSAFWILLIVTGVVVQVKAQRGKPPFPPRMRLHIGGANERTPLVRNVNRSPYVRRGSSDSDASST